jgi:hypothetical protein
MTFDNPVGSVGFFRRLLLARDTAALDQLRKDPSIREQILQALDGCEEEYINADERESIDLQWFAEVSEVLYGPEPHPPDIDGELKEITDHLENQVVQAGEILLDLVDSSDIPDYLRQLERYFVALPSVPPAAEQRLLHNPSNRKAGDVLPAVLARVGLTPLSFFQATGAVQNTLLAFARLSQGSLPPKTVVELSEKSTGRNVLTLEPCAKELQVTLDCPSSVSSSLMSWIFRVLPYRPSIVPDWQAVSRPGETLRLQLLPDWTHLTPSSPIQIAERWSAKALVPISYEHC